MTDMPDISTVSGVRTAIGDLGGGLNSLLPNALGNMVATAALCRAAVAGGQGIAMLIGNVA